MCNFFAVPSARRVKTAIAQLLFYTDSVASFFLFFQTRLRVFVQVYRGPNKAYGKDVKGYGYDDGAFAPHGHYFTQPEDEKGYGY